MGTLKEMACVFLAKRMAKNITTNMDHGLWYSWAMLLGLSVDGDTETLKQRVAEFVANPTIDE